MKLIHAILDPARLESVIEALGSAEVFRLTITEVEGAGHHRGSETIGEHQVSLDFLPRIRIEIAVNDHFVQPAIDAIRNGAQDEDAPGVIMVLPLDNVIRIRTGESGPAAI
jgi:nitrogen regulatory protein PII